MDCFNNYAGSTFERLGGTYWHPSYKMYRAGGDDMELNKSIVIADVETYVKRFSVHYLK